MNELSAKEVLSGDAARQAYEEILRKHEIGKPYYGPRMSGFFSEGELIVAFDNRDLECFVEEFQDERVARLWCRGFLTEEVDGFHDLSVRHLDAIRKPEIEAFPTDVVKWHVFSNGVDDFTADSNEAIELLLKHVEEQRCARLYIDVDDEGQTVTEDCLYAVGPYPN